MSDYLHELRPRALSAGISLEAFEELTLREIWEILEYHEKNELQERKQKIIDDFIIAEVTAVNLAALFAGEGGEIPRPWDYYTKLFEEERVAFEEEEKRKQLEEYKEKRRQYAAEHNRRRRQGMI